MSHGHGHGHGHVDIEAELDGKLPPPFCEGNWRQMVGTCAVMALAVLAVTLGSYFNESTAMASTSGATEATSMGMAASAASPGVAAGQGDGVVSVAGGPRVAGALDGNVRFVRGTDRTAFNTAAETVRPSVMGIRATLPARGAAGAKLDRVGSGVVVDPAGYVVTCYHVVAGTSSIAASRFREPDRYIAASLVAARDDLALLKVDDAAPFIAASIGDSEGVQVGDWVLAIGYPFGLGLTVTAGIVGRRHGALNVPGGRQYTGLLQTDAPINEGSSGGPLVDLGGRVVGLNTAIYAPTGVFSGAGFAIPSSQIVSFLAAHLPGFRSGRAQAVRSGRMASTPAWGLGERSPTSDTKGAARWPNASR